MPVSPGESSSLPFFKYNPRAYENGVIVQQKAKCNSCNKIREYIYQGPFFTEEEVENICPWCIQSGQAAEKFEGEFQDSASCKEVEDEQKLDELIHHTPGYNGWQQEKWLSHCNDYCAFIDHVGWKEIKDISAELEPDIKTLVEESDMTRKEFETQLEKEGSFQGYLFQCLHCKKHRLTADWD